MNPGSGTHPGDPEQPPKPRRGAPETPVETILAAVLFRMREGCSWRTLSVFAPHTTIYGRWKKWCQSGLWDRLLEALAESAKGALRPVDSTSVKVHKHAFGGPGGAEEQAVGRSRGGANTKIHAVVEAGGRAMRLLLTPGNRHDVAAAPELIEGLEEGTIVADKAYDSDAFRERLHQMGLGVCIPARGGRTAPERHRRGHYKKRHQIENFFQRIKEKRAIATRYEKLASRYRALVTLAIICDWLAN